MRDLQEQITGLDNLIDLYREQKVTCHKLGTVFLTYSDQKIALDIVNKY